MKKKEQEWAIFWCALLEPILFGEISPGETQAFLRKLASEERLFPNGKRKKPSLSTLRRKLCRFRRTGFESLGRKPRSDRGKPRAHGEELIQRAIELKRDQPRRSNETINQFLQSEHRKSLPKSTLYRHLKEAGATRAKLGILKKKVRRRFTRDHTHDLWLGDFEHGPYVLFDGMPVSTRLCAFIDCHSRFIVEGRYYYKETLDILIDSLLRAFAIHGAPKALYVDNAKVYHSKALRAACYAMNIQLIHRTKGDPAPGGLIERFFRTAQDQFEAEVREGSILTLEQINRAFFAWLEVSYHEREHRETKQPPKIRLESGLTAIRRVDMAAILAFFMEREVRRVDPTFSDVQLRGKFYRVDSRLRGDRVEVRFDPYSKMETVILYSLKEQYLGEGVLHEREKGEGAHPPTAPKKPRSNYLELLLRKSDRSRELHEGIDFRKALRHRPWPFPDFAKTCARLLGREGQLSAWTTDELEALKHSYDRVPSLTRTLLEEAVAKADSKRLPAVLFELHRIAKRKEI